MKYPKYKVKVKDCGDFWLLSQKACDQVAVNKAEYLNLKFAVEKINHIYDQIPLKGDFGLDQRTAYKYYKRLETLVN